MSWSITQLAQMSGVTSRTLRHYDNIGLLPPAYMGANGYRHYEQEQLLRLQEILLMRELGMDLATIARVLQGEIDRLEALRRHHRSLTAERDSSGWFGSRIVGHDWGACGGSLVWEDAAMSGGRQSEELATALAQMARDLLAQKSLQETLDRIVRYALELVEGCEHAGIMVVSKGTVRTLAASDDHARRSDRLQGKLGEGPCFDAARSGKDSALIVDMAAEADRWPRYGPEIQKMGIGSMLSFRLFTEEENLGALNLYSTRSGALTECSQQTGLLLASHAAVAFSSAQADADLHGAIATRREIGIALGILMERHKLSADEAFSVLSRASQETNIKLREIARRIAETGETADIA